MDNLTAKINSLSLSLDYLKERRNIHTPEEKCIKEGIIEKKLADAVRRQNEFINQIVSLFTYLISLYLVLKYEDTSWMDVLNYSDY